MSLKDIPPSTPCSDSPDQVLPQDIHLQLHHRQQPLPNVDTKQVTLNSQCLLKYEKVKQFVNS